jgi:hypothetical protein
MCQFKHPLTVDHQFLTFYKHWYVTTVSDGRRWSRGPSATIDGHRWPSIMFRLTPEHIQVTSIVTGAHWSFRKHSLPLQSRGSFVVHGYSFQFTSFRWLGGSGLPLSSIPCLTFHPKNNCPNFEFKSEKISNVMSVDFRLLNRFLQNRGRCYDYNFLRFSTIFGEKIGVFLKNQCYDQHFE